MDFVEVLHLEAVAVFFDEGFVVVGRERGPRVEGGVVDVDLDVVLAGLEEFGDVEAVGWMPERAGALAVDEDDGGFVDGWVVVGVHAGAGAGDARVGQAVGAKDGVFGWGVGGAGQWLCRLRLRGRRGVRRLACVGGTEVAEKLKSRA